MILCACGCGKEREEFNLRGKKIKYIWGHNPRGQLFLSENIEKRSKTRTGKHHSLKTIERMSEVNSGKNNPNYKGGKKLAKARSYAKRKQFGFVPLNDCSIDGWVGHHLDLNYVIFIPEELHKSIWHSVTKDVNMDIINDKVYEWVVNYYGLI